MDPDSGGYLNHSAIFKTSVLTVAFSSFYYYKAGDHFYLFKPAVATADSSLVIIAKTEIIPVKKKKTIYLTFDDGPNKGTRAVMHIAKQENVPVTLFIVGEHVYGSKYQSDIFDSVSTNHLFEIANHSYTHAFANKYDKFYAMSDSAVKDFIRCADSLKLGTNIIRTPGRNIWRTDSVSCTDLKNSIATADSLQNKGFKAIGWDLEWHFNGQKRLVQTVWEMINEIDLAFSKNNTKMSNHLVLLAHDQAYSNKDDSTSLKQFIFQLKCNDEYDFETVSKYPGIEKQN